MGEPIKCLVKGCQNHSDGGTMVGPLCAPCDLMLRTGKVPHRGLTFVHDMGRKLTVAREAVAKLQEYLLP